MPLPTSLMLFLLDDDDDDEDLIVKIFFCNFLSRSKRNNSLSKNYITINVAFDFEFEFGHDIHKVAI